MHVYVCTYVGKHPAMHPMLIRTGVPHGGHCAAIDTACRRTYVRTHIRVRMHIQYYMNACRYGIWRMNGTYVRTYGHNGIRMYVSFLVRWEACGDGAAINKCLAMLVLKHRRALVRTLRTYGRTERMCM
jgi:hypothetical protein